MAGPARGVSRWPVAVAMVLLVGALSATLWLRAQLVAQQAEELAGLVRRLDAAGTLGRPESRSLSFADLESFARSSESRFVRQVRVVKTTEKGEMLTVHPFAADLTEPNWRLNQTWLRLPVGKGPDGYIYLDVDRSTLRAVNAVVALIGVLLAGGLGLLLLRQRGSEVQISRLTEELEQRQAQIIHLERLALAGQLSANIFHDIKKPVLNIKHEVVDALDGMAGPPEEVFRMVRTQTELFLEMLREIGMESFVNATAQEREWCDLREVAERSLRLVRYEQGDVEVPVRFDAGSEYLLKAVPHRLVQLLSNLFLNAFQAMDGAGKLLVTGTERDGRMVLTVEDSGPGIPANKREELFKPFVTTRAATGGSGLGLYISRSIVQDLGGTLVVDKSEELGGARFRIELPRTEEAKRG